MNEPNLNKFMHSLQSENFRLSNVLTEESPNQEKCMSAYQAITYLSEEYACSVLDEYKKLSEDKQKLFVKNLIQLYPMSQHILYLILKSKGRVDEAMIDGFDKGELLLKTIRNIFNELEAYSSTWTKKTRDYQEDINSCQKKITKLKADIESNKEYLQQKEKLEHELVELQSEATDENRNQKLLELKQAINDLKREKENYDKSYRELHNKRKKLMEELSSLKGKLGNGNDEAELRKLLSPFPKDEGDDL